MHPFVLDRPRDLNAALALRAQASGSTAGIVGFGLLLALFGSGLVVSLVQTLLALRNSGRLTTDSATH